MYMCVYMKIFIFIYINVFMYIGPSSCVALLDVFWHICTSVLSPSLKGPYNWFQNGGKWS